MHFSFISNLYFQIMQIISIIYLFHFRYLYPKFGILRIRFQLVMKWWVQFFFFCDIRCGIKKSFKYILKNFTILLLKSWNFSCNYFRSAHEKQLITSMNTHIHHLQIGPNISGAVSWYFTKESFFISLPF